MLLRSQILAGLRTTMTISGRLRTITHFPKASRTMMLRRYKVAQALREFPGVRTRRRRQPRLILRGRALHRVMSAHEENVGCVWCPSADMLIQLLSVLSPSSLGRLLVGAVCPKPVRSFNRRESRCLCCYFRDTLGPNAVCPRVVSDRGGVRYHHGGRPRLAHALGVSSA